MGPVMDGWSYSRGLSSSTTALAAQERDVFEVVVVHRRPVRPMLRNIVLGKDSIDRADRLAGGAVYAFVRK